MQFRGGGGGSSGVGGWGLISVSYNLPMFLNASHARYQ